MAKSHEENQLNLSAKLAQFIQSYRKIIAITAGVVLIVLLVIGGMSYLQERKSAAGALAAEELQDQYVLWMNAEDDEEKSDLETSLKTIIDETVSSYKGTMAEQRAHLMAGTIAFEQKDWQQALLSFTEISKRFPKSYLAPVALMNQGAVHEEMGENREALEVYQLVADSYTGFSPEVPHALFSIGRLYEITGQNESALEAYRKLAESFPESDWTKLGRDRIIYLEAR